MLVESGFDASKVALIANAVDIERFRASGGRDERRRALCGERRLVGIYVGRLEWEKGVELMLRGWARVLQSRDDALLLVVGNGSLQPSLERLCELLGISDQVKFLGPTKQPETFLQLADFGLLASLHEGLSNRCSNTCRPACRCSGRGSAATRTSSSRAAPAGSSRRATKTRTSMPCVVPAMRRRRRWRR
ncbi:glycosyltransferase [Piscinibacter aquaticus]|uniref:Glycosyltransferase n=1 Tax=Piscinibacter aquaticus TaxID=392597 RepID=A0A5C6U3T2_9BURK|nr:glycosyltransferase [Piscinibacter aquaticus]